MNEPKSNSQITFAHRKTRVRDVELHFVTAGKGQPVLLLAGWPQTWYAWRRVMPILAQHYTVVALDMRGLGDSEKPQSGYDTRTVAEDIFHLVQQFGGRRFFLVGHDVGAWVAYAYAAAYPKTVRRLVVLDAAIPGITPMQAFGLSRDSKTWQFVFHAVPDLPEEMTAGRERMYLSWFFCNKSAHPEAITAEALDEYVRCYSAPGGMRAGFEYYRAVFEDIEQNQEYAKTRLMMPVLVFGGEKATGDRMLQTMQTAADDVRGGVIPDCGHYIPEECPEFLAEQLIAFFKEDKAGPTK